MPVVLLTPTSAEPMLTLIACAKTMKVPEAPGLPDMTPALFETEARANALEMLRFTPEELEKLLHVGAKIAGENYLRFREFHAADRPLTPALLTYSGAVFRRIAPGDFSEEDFRFAQHHLLITSFLYGLLRPLDGIRLYRLEGDVRLRDGLTMFDYWKPQLTERLIASVREQGGVLVNLASTEMKALFDWKRVEASVQVVTPEFRVWKGDRLKTVVMYAKMCRGEMTRFIIKHRLDTPSSLQHFSWDGFSFDSSRSTPTQPVFTL